MWCSTRSHAKVLALLALAALATPVCASTREPSPAPGPAQAPAAALATPAVSHPLLPGSRLQGMATLRFFGLRVYHARLWALPDFHAGEPTTQPVVLELEYLRELKGQAIAERSLVEMRRAATIGETQAVRWLSEMQRLFPDVKAGDRLTGQHLPGQGVRFWHNGQPSGQFDDAQFARLFFGIWLAPTTSEPDLRLALLGLAPSGTRR